MDNNTLSVWMYKMLKLAYKTGREDVKCNNHHFENVISSFFKT